MPYAQRNKNVLHHPLQKIMSKTSCFARKIPLNELPQWSPWPERLLGIKGWQTPRRTVEKIDSEYDKDKYADCLMFVKRQKEIIDASDVKNYELRSGNLGKICISRKGKLYEMPADRIADFNANLLTKYAKPFMKKVDTVVEIGCGYGINLWELSKKYPGKKYIGGEYSKNAIETASMLYENSPLISVKYCNFYDSTYNILEQCGANSKVLLITRHAIEQLPTAENVIQTLSQYFDRLVAVVHMEPIHENCDNTLLGMMRKKYTKMNDYNQDLLSIVQNRNDIEILRNDYDVYGVSPLNPTSVLIWKPKEKQRKIT
ncbi:MAG: class I SAM-dependent methyltransferase [Candidatus Peribacteraceae bacterium]|nr:class I SAM-dependent methyltransferase [Candidatus Peribacteraceae bacterium]